MFVNVQWIMEPTSPVGSSMRTTLYERSSQAQYMDAGSPSNRFQDRKKTNGHLPDTLLVVEHHLFDTHVADIFPGKELGNAVPCLFHRFSNVHSDLLFHDRSHCLRSGSDETCPYFNAANLKNC